MIGNLDETMLNSKGRSMFVVKRGTRFAISQDLSTNEHITILKLIINNGYGFTPLFIFKLTHHFYYSVIVIHLVKTQIFWNFLKLIIFIWSHFLLIAHILFNHQMLEYMVYSKNTLDRNFVGLMGSNLNLVKKLQMTLLVKGQNILLQLLKHYISHVPFFK